MIYYLVLLQVQFGPALHLNLHQKYTFTLMSYSDIFGVQELINLEPVSANLWKVSVFLPSAQLFS